MRKKKSEIINDLVKKKLLKLWAKRNLILIHLQSVTCIKT